MSGSSADSSAWDRLNLYRERYDIEDRLGIVARLEQSIRRREVRLAAARRRVAELEATLAESRHDLRVIEGEIEESGRIWPPLIDEIIEQVRVDFGEAWTPRPIRGFRLWQVKPAGLFGVTNSRWLSRSMEATCLRDIPGEDLPHPGSLCGPPGCGVYATKRIEDLDLGKAGWLAGDRAIGVVALTGKVIEHDGGYRGARAKVVAFAIRWGMRWVMTSDVEVIESLFNDTLNAVVAHGSKGEPADAVVADFLNEAKKEDEAWI